MIAAHERRVEMSNSKNRVGFVLADKYEIISEMGCGSMSVMWVAKDRKLDTLWVVKEFLKRDDADEELELHRGITSEVEWQRGHLNHPAIANDQLPEGLELIIRKSTEYNPEDRYNNCGELKADLVRHRELADALAAKRHTVGKRLRSLFFV